MSKLHQSCSTSMLVVLVLFGTQLLLAQQSNTLTYFRHPQPKRLLETITCPLFPAEPCEAQRSFDDSESDETFNVEVPANSNFTLEIQFTDQTEILIEFIFGDFGNVRAQIEVFTMRSNKNSVAVAANSDLDNNTNIMITTNKNSLSNRLVIFLQNPDSSLAYIDVSVSQPNNELAPWIIPVAVTGGILLVIITISMLYIWLRKRRERRQLQWIYQGNFYGGAQPNQIAVEDKDVFNIERDLDKMFPEAKNQNFKSSFPQKTCTICLEDFQGDQICRQLQCQHIFHTECVKLWLASQAEKKLKVFCPNCHKEIVKKVDKKAKS